MIIGGVDLGARKAAVSIFNGPTMTHVDSIEFPSTTRAKEVASVGHWVWTQLRICDSVWVEEPLIGRGVRASLQIAHTAGAVLCQLAADVKHIDFVPVTTWKRDVVGNARADKQQVADWLYQEHSKYSALCAGNQDRVDATCIGLYGVGISDRLRLLEDLR